MTMRKVWVIAGFILVVTAAAAPADEGFAKRDLTARVRLETSLGPIVVELSGARAPGTTRNFVRYVEDGYYNGTIFHRVLEGGLIQGGAFTETLDRKTEGLRDGTPHEPDSGLTNRRGTIAAFRTAGKVDSAKAEFFINVGNNPVLDRRHLDGAAYTVFGKVVEGMETVDRIASAPVSTHPKYARGRTKVVPVKPVIIKSATMLSPFDHKAAIAKIEQMERERKAAERDATDLQELAVAARIQEVEKKFGMKLTAEASGLRHLTVRSGTGAPPIKSETVAVHYIGTLANGFEFENTYTRDNSLPIKKIVSKFIKGLREGILDMHEGEKRMFVVPPELGFGADGIPGRIPPDSTLFYELELLAIEDER